MEQVDRWEWVDRENRWIDVNRWTNRTDGQVEQVDRWDRWTDEKSSED